MGVGVRGVDGRRRARRPGHIPPGCRGRGSAVGAAPVRGRGRRRRAVRVSEGAPGGAAHGAPDSTDRPACRRRGRLPPGPPNGSPQRLRSLAASATAPLRPRGRPCLGPLRSSVRRSAPAATQGYRVAAGSVALAAAVGWLPYSSSSWAAIPPPSGQITPPRRTPPACAPPQRPLSESARSRSGKGNRLSSPLDEHRDVCSIMTRERSESPLRSS